MWDRAGDTAVAVDSRYFAGHKKQILTSPIGR